MVWFGLIRFGFRNSSYIYATERAAVSGALDAETREKMKASLPSPGEGPPAWFRALGFWEMRFVAEGEEGAGDAVWCAMRGGGGVVRPTGRPVDPSRPCTRSSIRATRASIDSVVVVA